MTQRDRFYWRTISYHVWGIFRRHDDNMPIAVKPNSALDRLVESVGANKLGDAEARDRCRHRTNALNWREARNAGIILDDQLSI